jgi:hypothetical protein
MFVRGMPPAGARRSPPRFPAEARHTTPRSHTPPAPRPFQVTERRRNRVRIYGNLETAAQGLRGGRSAVYRMPQPAEAPDHAAKSPFSLAGGAHVHRHPDPGSEPHRACHRGCAEGPLEGPAASASRSSTRELTQRRLRSSATKQPLRSPRSLRELGPPCVGSSTCPYHVVRTSHGGHDGSTMGSRRERRER